ncbi:signal transduction histidine kinase [Actinocrispum wychmicini]|uniref:histidine kinase n=1 Tax=Actinocrispum wychmicini TaxID=1213861 RepID=A0A4R2IY67_9PSEU|nr:signal transduction histidine kinase [Actinocrispum wychmicini]
MVGAAVALAVLGSTLIQDDVDGGRQLTVVGAALILLSGGVLALGGRYPVLVAAVTLACSAIYYPFVGTGGPMLVTFIIALYYVSASGRVVVAAAFAAVCVVAIAVGEKFSPVRHLDNIAQFMLAGWMVAMIALGVARNTRRAYAEEASKRATTEERLRIARELHDVLAHNISLINVQASAALHRKNHTAGLWEALEAIKQASKEALREVRATLGVLRAVDESAPTGPPGLHQLPELVRRTRQTGVEVTVDGEPRALPPEIDLAAYRIIQEALTNVTRHASARSVHVRITYGDKDMSVQVDDDGRGGSLVPGNGIRGMTERAQALGGSLTVRGDDHGVQVAASLPLGAAE